MTKEKQIVYYIHYYANPFFLYNLRPIICIQSGFQTLRPGGGYYSERFVVYQILLNYSHILTLASYHELKREIPIDHWFTSFNFLLS